ncbi:MAG: hypothetical protein HYX68_29690 [Planctomycetes bacterium]|nr:hypothetical protein [Planctomycetota bacterium]
MNAPTRRQFFGAAATVPFLGCDLPANQPARRPRVAAIYTVYRFRSHAHNILENFLCPYLFNGRRANSPCEVVSFFAHQRSPMGDTTDTVARQYRIPVFPTIERALTLGGKDLAVDAVLLIGEHGEYPHNRLGQHQYPRKQFFDEIVRVMRRSNRFVPIFNDKHLSYHWPWAREMYDTCVKHRIPFMAGSSVPLAQRLPALEIPTGTRIEEAVSIHAGGVESYDFHALEVLQSIVEARRGGETGVRSVEFLAGDTLFDAARQGRWSLRLAEAAMSAELGRNVPDLRQPIRGERAAEPHGLIITYHDGFRATMLKIGASSNRWNFACKYVGDARLRPTRFYNGPYGNRCLFMGLSHAIQDHFVNRRSPYPVERTLLTTGLTDAVMQSRAAGTPIETPHLSIRYAARDFRPMREMGASWRVLGDQPERRTVGMLADG